MVDVSGKEATDRTALARGKIRVSPQVLSAILDHAVGKGDVLGVARIAGIMAVKRTWEFIPLCHPLMVSKVDLNFIIPEDENSVVAECSGWLLRQNGGGNGGAYRSCRSAAYNL